MSIVFDGGGPSTTFFTSTGTVTVDAENTPFGTYDSDTATADSLSVDGDAVDPGTARWIVLYDFADIGISDAIWEMRVRVRAWSEETPGATCDIEGVTAASGTGVLTPSDLTTDSAWYEFAFDYDALTALYGAAVLPATVSGDAFGFYLRAESFDENSNLTLHVEEVVLEFWGEKGARTRPEAADPLAPLGAIPQPSSGDFLSAWRQYT